MTTQSDRTKSWRARNPDKVKAYRKTHIEQYRKYMQGYMKRYRANKKAALNAKTEAKPVEVKAEITSEGNQCA